MHCFGFAAENRKKTLRPATHVRKITTAEDGTLDSKWHPALSCVCLRKLHRFTADDASGFRRVVPSHRGTLQPGPLVTL